MLAVRMYMGIIGGFITLVSSLLLSFSLPCVSGQVRLVAPVLCCLDLSQPAELPR